MAELDFYIHVKSNEDGTAAEITKIPAADVAPVKHGGWIGNENKRWTCSECGESADLLDGRFHTYCPCCGAKMGVDG